MLRTLLAPNAAGHVLFAIRIVADNVQLDTFSTLAHVVFAHLNALLAIIHLYAIVVYKAIICR